MKKNLILTVALAIVVVSVLNGCKKEEPKPVCAVCGGEATQTLSGPLEFLVEEGISEEKCREVVSGVYSAYICNSCLDSPVATIERQTD